MPLPATPATCNCCRLVLTCCCCISSCSSSCWDPCFLLLLALTWGCWWPASEGPAPSFTSRLTSSLGSAQQQCTTQSSRAARQSRRVSGEIIVVEDQDITLPPSVLLHNGATTTEITSCIAAHAPPQFKAAASCYPLPSDCTHLCLPHPTTLPAPSCAPAYQLPAAPAHQPKA